MYWVQCEYYRVQCIQCTVELYVWCEHCTAGTVSCVQCTGFSKQCSIYCTSVHYSLYNGLAIYTEVTFVNVTLVEAVPSGGGPAVV